MPRKAKTFQKASITVAFMVEQLSKVVRVPLETVYAGTAEEQLVTESNLHRPGLALAGYVDLFTHQRVQILGNTENRYLQHLALSERITAFKNLLQFPIPCLILTDNNLLDPELIEVAKSQQVPIYRTSVPSTEFLYFLRDLLEDQFAPQMTLHGSLVDVYGAGILLKGQPGIGKSEIALDLIERGHRLVADDVVVVTKKGGGVVMGAGTDVAKHFMEIRGLGLVDVRAMFGIRAIRFQKRVEVVVDLHVWNPEEEYTRLGMADDTINLLGVKLPWVKLPIIPGKNITVICEVIAMNYLLQHYGYDPAKEFAQRLSKRIESKKNTGPRRGIEYFEHDYE